MSLTPAPYQGGGSRLVIQGHLVCPMTSSARMRSRLRSLAVSSLARWREIRGSGSVAEDPAERHRHAFETIGVLPGEPSANRIRAEVAGPGARLRNRRRFLACVAGQAAPPGP